MQEFIKNRPVLILTVLTLIFFIIAVGSCTKSRKQNSLIQQQASSHMDLEAKIATLQQERQALLSSLQETKQKLEEAEAALESTKKALSQEQMINNSLKSELEKVSKLKEALEQQLRESGKPSKGRR